MKAWVFLWMLFFFVYFFDECFETLFMQFFFKLYLIHFLKHQSIVLCFGGGVLCFSFSFFWHSIRSIVFYLSMLKWNNASPLFTIGVLLIQKMYKLPSLLLSRCQKAIILENQLCLNGQLLVSFSLGFLYNF